MYDILKRLCGTSSPSGFEQKTAEEIINIAEALGLSCETDALGNVIVRRSGVGKCVMIDAHMDTTGFLATYTDENGFVRFDMIGGLSVNDFCNTPIKFLNGTRGSISFETGSDEKKRKTDSFYIDIGADGADSAKRLVTAGDAAVFSEKLRKLAKNRICGPYLDNRIGCAVVLSALSKLDKCQYDVCAVFSVQEEVGCRGAKTAAYAVEADYAVVVDVTDSNDTPGCKTKSDVKLGSGVAIKIMDTEAIAHPMIVSALCETAEREKIPYTRDVVSAGGTNAGSIHLTRSGIPTGGISIPVRYMHSPCETADLSDAENAEKLLVSVLENHAFMF